MADGYGLGPYLSGRNPRPMNFNRLPGGPFYADNEYLYNPFYGSTGSSGSGENISFGETDYSRPIMIGRYPLSSINMNPDGSGFSEIQGAPFQMINPLDGSVTESTYFGAPDGTSFGDFAKAAGLAFAGMGGISALAGNGFLGSVASGAGAGGGAAASAGAESFLPMHEATHSAGFLSELGSGGIAGGLARGGSMNFLSNLGTRAASGLANIFRGGGEPGGGGGGGLGGLDWLGLGAGAFGAYKQNDAANHMLDWLNSQQAKIDNLYAPNSPEYNALFDQLSRQDAASGRNSQYGPRSVDLAARIAEIKARNTANLTTGIGNTYAAALNNKANAFAGIPALLNYGRQRGMSTGLPSLFGNNSNSSGLDGFFNAVDSGQVELPPDYLSTNGPQLDDAGIADLFNFYGG